MDVITASLREGRGRYIDSAALAGLLAAHDAKVYDALRMPKPSLFARARGTIGSYLRLCTYRELGALAGVDPADAQSTVR